MANSRKSLRLIAYAPGPDADPPNERSIFQSFPLLCNGEEGHFVGISSWETPGSQNPGRKDQLEVHADWPLDATGIVAAGKVLESVAEAACSYWAEAAPYRAALDIAKQTSSGAVGGSPDPPRGLPALKLPSQIGSPDIPSYLGWLNYWSAATAQTLGFPDPARDAELLTRSRRTATGGWIVQLTEAPLDLDNPLHLGALAQAYERFPEVGGRTAA